jgi:predicted amidohydrolase
MRIAIAQIKPVTGNIEANIVRHLQFVDQAIDQRADAIFFPELSLTSYEPTLAGELAMDLNDQRLGVFQQRSDHNNIIIAAGGPLKAEGGTQIGMFIFQPGMPRQVYAKQFLHSDELPYFINGNKQVLIHADNNQCIAPGICYETSLPEHWENAHQRGAGIYVASVAKSANGVERSVKIFPAMAVKYNMTVLLSNSLGPSDNFTGAGQSAAWDNKGQLVAQLDDTREGILIYDTVNRSTSEIIL